MNLLLSYLCVKSTVEALRGLKVVTAMSDKFYLFLLSLSVVGCSLRRHRILDITFKYSETLNNEYIGRIYQMSS